MKSLGEKDVSGKEQDKGTYILLTKLAKTQKINQESFQRPIIKRGLICMSEGRGPDLELGSTATSADKKSYFGTSITCYKRQKSWKYGSAKIIAPNATPLIRYEISSPLLQKPSRDLAHPIADA